MRASVLLEPYHLSIVDGVNIGEVSATQSALLKDLDLFDPRISSKDARMATIGMRKLAQLSLLALLDSGIDYRGWH